MAYVSQEMKKEKLAKMKTALKKYNLKGSMSVKDHMTLVLKIQSGAIDFISNYVETIKDDAKVVYHGIDLSNVKYLNINQYHYKRNFTGVAKEALDEIMSVMFEGHWDESDIQTDHFNCSYYVDVNIGTWNKPYMFSA